MTLLLLAVPFVAYGLSTRGAFRVEAAVALAKGKKIVWRPSPGNCRRRGDHRSWSDACDTRPKRALMVKGRL
jgi:hypothetical protein